MSDERQRDRHGLVVLDEDECYSRLSQNHIGRLAIAASNGPEIYPINYAVDDDRNIVFRTTLGRKWVEAIWSHPVAFEIDDYDIETHTGWSVMVAGRAETVPEDEVEKMKSLRVRPWATPEASQWVRIVPRRVSGRVIPHGPRVWRV